MGISCDPLRQDGSVVHSRGIGASHRKAPPRKEFMNSTRLRLFLLFLFLVILPSVYAQEPKTGEDVLRAMHDRYAKTWYQTLTFTQKSTTYNPDGTSKAETWYEAIKLPAKLRIDIGPPASGNGFLLVDGTVYIYRDGKQAGTRSQVNMLLVLGFDVYGQSPETTVKVVTGEGFDLQKVHEDTWEGNPVYVVGADKGDLKSKQFWIDKKRLLFVRIFEPSPADATKIDDIRFEDYRELAGGWIAARVEVYADEKKVFSEEYSDIQPNPKLDPAVFDPNQFATTHWEKP
jgi:outer membrane lipoprotein-sorting protein